MSKLAGQKAVFLDRDGVLNKDKGYTYKVEDLEWLSQVPEALKTLKQHGFLLIVVSNQSGVARGYYTQADVEAFHEHMQKELREKWNVAIEAFYYCPHLIGGSVPAFSMSCVCRKPQIGMIEQAQKDFSIDLDLSFLVGDKESDVECAHRAGVQGIRVGDNAPDGMRTLFEVLPIILGG
jgi:D-glycero-D-manno-heptose 1,7-bisphosphate phosphatase